MTTPATAAWRTTQPAQPEPPAQPDPRQPAPPGRNSHAEEFSAFYLADMPFLVAFLVYRGVPAADASECAQEAMNKAFQLWEGITSPTAWVRATASHAYARRVESFKELPAADFGTQIPASYTVTDPQAARLGRPSTV